MYKEAIREKEKKMVGEVLENNSKERGEDT